LNVTRNSDDSYVFDLYQKSVTGIDSAPLLFTWVRDTVAPATPTLNSPATSPYTTNGNAIVIAGQCEDHALLTLDGDDQQQVNCSGGNFSFQVTASIDGVRNYLVSQTDRAGNTSARGNRIWIRDTVAPLAVTLTNPTTNPYISGDTTLSLNGNCEAGGEVTVTALPANQNQTQGCSGAGTFSFTLTQGVNGTYSYSVKQRDPAGNISPDLAFEWTIDNTIPPSPIIVSPNLSPVYTKTGTLVLQLTCAIFSPVVGVVNLAGDVTSGNVTSPSGSLSTNCNSGSAQFTLQKTTDGSYSILVDQTNPNTGANSAPASLLWVVDTVAPPAPTLISPSSNPYVAPGDLTLQGTCETGATLNLEGAIQHSETCQGGTFQWVITSLPDGEYDFTITQTDLALNDSGPTHLHWIRSVNALSPPVVMAPATNPHSSNQLTLTLGGSCEAGATVTLAGAQNDSSTCSASGQFIFTLSPSADGTLLYDLKQSKFGIESSSTSFQWIRDTVTPSVQITAQPSVVNLANQATFAFTSNESGSTFECKLDNGTYTACASPMTLTPTNGLHSYSIRATDPAGNIGLAQVINWEQKSYNTLALYRFDASAALTTDSGPYLNHLTNNGPVQYTASGIFSGGASFTNSATQSFSIAQNASLNLGTSALTIEGFFRLANLAARNDYYTLIYKGASASDMSYEVRLRRGSNNNQYFIDVVTKLAGAAGTVTSATSTIGTIQSGSTPVWTYFAVTYTQGVMRVYTGTATGQATMIRGTFNLGTSASTLATSGGSLQIGRGPSSATMKPLNGTVDEIRISQTVRNVSIVPSATFNPTQ
jgi:hypothetical protein